MIDRNFVLGMTQENNALLEATGASITQNALVLYSSTNRQLDVVASNNTSMAGFTDTGNDHVISSGDYSGSYSIYQNGEAYMYVHNNIKILCRIDFRCLL